MKKFKQLKFQRVSLVAQMVKNSPAIRETWVQSQVWDDPLKSMANPVQYSCLENPTDRGTWRATICGAAKRREWLISRAQQRNGRDITTGLTEIKTIKKYCKQSFNNKLDNLRWKAFPRKKQTIDTNSRRNRKSRDGIGNQKPTHGDFPESPVAKTPSSQCRAPRFDPWSRY